MFRQVIRSLIRVPAFSMTAVLTVALGIGVNTVIFSVVHTVLLDPLPYRDPGRLVHISETHPEFPAFQVAAPDYFDWRSSAKSFEEMAAHTFQAMNQTTLLGQGEPERVQAVQASWQLFPMLGVRMLQGRAFTSEEEAKQIPVALLSESLWRRKFNADPSIIGRGIRLQTFAFTVVGIIPDRQAYPAWADVWMPLSLLEKQLQETRSFHTLEVVGRLKPTVTVEQAQAEMVSVAAHLAQTYPTTNKTVGSSVLPLASSITSSVRPALLIAWAAVGLVLLLACANVAHLVMVRAVGRSSEMAVRAALGASTLQLMRVVLAENLTLAVTGGALGVVLASAILPLVSRLAWAELPRIDALALSPVTFVVGAGATLLCALLFALPALFHARGVELTQTMKARSRGWFGASMIAAEIALAFVVVTGAGLLYRSLNALLHEDIGYKTNNILAITAPLSVRDWNQSGRMFKDQVAPRIRQIPGVTSVAAGNSAPMSLGPTEYSRYATRFSLPGHVYDAGKFPVAQLRWISPDYFQTLGIVVTRGRTFTDADATKPGFVVNETFARRYFPGRDPVGEQVLTGVMTPNPTGSPIIGVVADVRDLSYDSEPRPTLYSQAVSPGMTLLIGTAVDPGSLIPAVRQAIRAADPDAPITKIGPLSAIVDASIARRRFSLYLLGAFAALAIALTAIGVYGVISYWASRRAREFAIRHALGAQRRHMQSLVLKTFAIPAAAGLVLGGWLAYVFALAMRTQLYKLSPADPTVLACTAGSLLALVILAALKPSLKSPATSLITLRE